MVANDFFGEVSRTPILMIFKLDFQGILEHLEVLKQV